MSNKLATKAILSLTFSAKKATTFYKHYSESCPIVSQTKDISTLLGGIFKPSCHPGPRVCVETEKIVDCLIPGQPELGINWRSLYTVFSAIHILFFPP